MHYRYQRRGGSIYLAIAVSVTWNVIISFAESGNYGNILSIIGIQPCIIRKEFAVFGIPTVEFCVEIKLGDSNATRGPRHLQILLSKSIHSHSLPRSKYRSVALSALVLLFKKLDKLLIVVVVIPFRLIIPDNRLLCFRQSRHSQANAQQVKQYRGNFGKDTLFFVFSFLRI